MKKLIVLAYPLFVLATMFLGACAHEKESTTTTTTTREEAVTAPTTTRATTTKTRSGGY
jgi:hypothetical protein